MGALVGPLSLCVLYVMGASTGVTLDGLPLVLQPDVVHEACCGIALGPLQHLAQ
jgi:hypothetical protein